MTLSLCMGLYENVVVVIVRCRDILPPVEGSLVRKRVASPQGSPHPLLHRVGGRLLSLLGAFALDTRIHVY